MKQVECGELKRLALTVASAHVILAMGWASFMRKGHFYMVQQERTSIDPKDPININSVVLFRSAIEEMSDKGLDHEDIVKNLLPGELNAQVLVLREFFRELVSHYVMTREEWEDYDESSGEVHGREGESGQGLAEYALILAFVAVVCIIGITALGLAIAGKLTSVGTALT